MLLELPRHELSIHDGCEIQDKGLLLMVNYSYELESRIYDLQLVIQIYELESRILKVHLSKRIHSV